MTSDARSFRSRRHPSLQGLVAEHSTLAPEALQLHTLATSTAPHAATFQFNAPDGDNQHGDAHGADNHGADNHGAGSLRYLWFDILLHGKWFVTYELEVVTANGSQSWPFSPLCECQTRMVFPLPENFGLSHGVTVTICILRKTEAPALFALWPVVFSEQEPPTLVAPLLPQGPLLDALGRSTLHHAASHTADEAVLVRRLRRRSRRETAVPATRSRWGGWKERRVERTGFFRTHHDGQRWWLVDPDGYLFWSSGLDCVHSSIDHEAKLQTRYQDLRGAHTELPNVLGEFGSCYRLNPWHTNDDREYNYLEANMIRAFGREDWYSNWTSLAHAELRNLGFNTAGDWSDEYAARREGTPYVRPLELWFHFPHTAAAMPGFPDVFDPHFEHDAATFAEAALSDTVDDPALLGYFLHNEPAWHRAQGAFAEGGLTALMLAAQCESRTREELLSFLLQRYGTRRALNSAWNNRAPAVLGGDSAAGLSAAAICDLHDFGTVMLERLCSTLSAACRRVDPHHLNLGLRWWTFPPLWALKAMGSFDVVSFNYYDTTVAAIGYGQQPEAGVDDVMTQLNRPFLVGEWHFGALDGGLPAAGLYRAADQDNRGKAFRNYLEHAATLPWCVGAHWFNMYDRTALSSTSSSENYNIGFFDITHQRHAALCRAARQSNAQLYEVASGRRKPYNTSVDFRFPSR